MKCKICTKKIRLIDELIGKCKKCNNYYCLNHRLSENHFCTHNHKMSFEEKNNFIETNKCIMEKIIKL